MTPISNHSLILLSIVGIYSHRVYRKKFKFENHWLLEDGLRDVVTENWTFDLDADLSDKLSRCARDLDHRVVIWLSFPS